MLTRYTVVVQEYQGQGKWEWRIPKDEALYENKAFVEHYLSLLQEVTPMVYRLAKVMILEEDEIAEA